MNDYEIRFLKTITGSVKIRAVSKEDAEDLAYEVLIHNDEHYQEDIRAASYHDDGYDDDDEYLTSTFIGKSLVIEDEDVSDVEAVEVSLPDGEIVTGKKHVYTYLPGVDFRYTDACGEWLVDYFRREQDADVFVVNEDKMESLRRQGHVHRVGKVYCLPSESEGLRRSKS